MPRPLIDRSRELKKIADRAERARVEKKEVAAEAGIHPVTFSRILSKGRCSVGTLGQLEDAMTRIEQRKAAAE